MAKRETEVKRDRQLKDKENRLREINDSLKKKNLRVIRFLRAPKWTEGQNKYLNKSYLKTFLIWEGKQAFRSRK